MHLRARAWLAALLCVALLPAALSYVHSFHGATTGSPALHPDFGLVFPTPTPLALDLANMSSSANHTLEICVRWLAARGSVCTGPGACRVHDTTEPLYTRNCFEMHASREHTLVLNCTRVALERVVARADLDGARVRWAFTPEAAQTCPTVAAAQCYTGLRARVLFDSAYEVPMPVLHADTGTRTYAPVWSFNPDHTEHGYFRRTRYRAEGGISFTNDVRAREDTVRADATAGVCVRTQQATLHTATVVVASTPTLPRDSVQCPCPPGTHIASTGCKVCAPGTFSAVQNQTACSDCTVGTYQPAANATGCVACPNHETTAGTRSIHESNCTDCPTGQYLQQDSTGPNCAPCPDTKPVYNATSKSCSQCPALHVFDVQAAGCRACSRGQFYDTGVSLCKDCEPGTYAPAGNRTACLQCPGAAARGMPAAWHVDNCTTCAASYFSAGGDCAPCPVGTEATGLSATRCECVEPGTARTYSGYSHLMHSSINDAVVAVHAAAPGGARVMLDFAVGGRTSDGRRNGLRVQTIDEDTTPLLSAVMEFPKAYNYTMQVFASSGAREALVFGIYYKNLLSMRLTLEQDQLGTEETSTNTEYEEFPETVLAVAAGGPALNVEFVLLNSGNLTRRNSTTSDVWCQVVLLPFASEHTVHPRMFLRADAQMLAVVGSTAEGSTWRVWLVPAVCSANTAPPEPVWTGTGPASTVRDVSFVDENSGDLLVVATSNNVWLVRRGAGDWRAERIYNATHAHIGAMLAPHSGRIFAAAGTQLYVYEPDQLCRPCAPGKYAPTPASAQDPLCRECAAHTYSDVSGQTACKTCTPQYVPNAEHTACERNGSCTIYEEAQAIALRDIEWCMCGPGLVRVNATACRQCAAGSYAPGGNASACTACALGAYSAGAGSSTCVLCAAGEYTNSSSSTVCTACTPGSYTNHTGASACGACALGTYAAGTAATECTACPAGEYTNSSSSTVCTACTPGSYTNHAGASACGACAVGTYAAGTAATECTACAAGEYTNSSSSTVCTACTPGTYAGSTGMSACSMCSPGYHSPDSGGSACLACVAGQYATDAGSSICDLCVVGTYSSAPGASACVECPDGLNTSAAGAWHSGRCVPPGGAACDPDNCTCQPGYHVLHNSDHDTDTGATCEPCATGKYIAESSQKTACDECGVMLEHSVTKGLAAAHADACVCPPGRQRSTGVTECEACALGTYNPVHNGSCIACAGEGNTTSQPGALHAHQCHCPKGSQHHIDGESGCVACASGSVSAGSGAPCQQCSADSYADLEAGVCTVCPPRHRAQPGAPSLSYCKTCAPRFGWDTQIYKCTTCGGASYGPGDEQLCVPCAEGQYAEELGCVPCPLGFTRHVGEDACERCEADTYGVHALDVGGTARAECAPCADNKVSPPGSSRAESCVCGLGYALYDGNCVHCPVGTQMRFPETREGQLQCVLCSEQCACNEDEEKAEATGGCVLSSCASGDLRRAEEVVRSPYMLGDGQSTYGNLLVELLAEKLGVCTQHVHVTALQGSAAPSRRLLEHTPTEAPEDEYKYNVTVQYPAANATVAKTFTTVLNESAVFHIERADVAPTLTPGGQRASSGSSGSGGSSMPVFIGAGISFVGLIAAFVLFRSSRKHAGLKRSGARASVFDPHLAPQQAVFYPSVFHGEYLPGEPSCFEVVECGLCGECAQQQCTQCRHAAAPHPVVFF